MHHSHRNSQGFSTVEIILVLWVIAVIGFVGWYVWKAKQNTNSTYNNANSALTGAKPTAKPKSTASTTPTSVTPAPANDYLVIKEWKIKVKLADADKLTYTMNGTPNGTSPNADGIVSYAALSLNDNVNASAECKRMTVSISQHLASNNASNGTNIKTVGSYAYGIDGSPNTCSDATINSLQEKIFNELLQLQIVTE